MHGRPQPGYRRLYRKVDAGVGEPPLLDHREDEARRADLEVRRHLAHVGVADDDVQPPVALRVRVRLIAGVDDRPFQRRLKTDLDFKEVGPPRDLEPVLAAVLTDADAAGAGDDL